MASSVINQARKDVSEAPPAPKSVAQPFDDIMRRYSGMVYNRCLHITRNTADAEDATQAVFLTLSMHLQSSKQIKYVGPWLEQVAKRVSLNLIRSRKRRTRRENVVAEMRPPETLDSCQPDLDELRAVIREEVNLLPTKYRLPLVLHYFGDTSTEEMARELGCTTNALCVRLHRGREMLRKRLAERGVVMSVTGLGLAVAQIIRSAVSENLAQSLLYTATTVSTSSIAVPHVVGTHVAALASGALKPVLGTKLALGAFVMLALGAGTWSGADRIEAMTRTLQLNIPTMNPAATLRELFNSAVPRLQADAEQNKDQDKHQDPSTMPSVGPYTAAVPAPKPSFSATFPGGTSSGIGQASISRHGLGTPSGPIALGSSPFTNPSFVGTHHSLPLPPQVNSRSITSQDSSFRSNRRNLDGQQYALGPVDVTFGAGDGEAPVGTTLGPGDGTGKHPGDSIALTNGTGTYHWPNQTAAESGDPYVQITLTDVTNASPLVVTSVPSTEFDTLDLPQGHTFVSVWTLDTLARFDEADLLVRYDERQVAELGLKEENLKLWIFDGQWKRIDDGKLLDKNLIWGDIEGSGLSHIAISTPEPGAIMGLGLGAGYFLLRRRRHQK